MAESKITDLFAVPLMQVKQAVDPALIDQLVALTRETATKSNSTSSDLSHSAVSTPDQHPLLTEVDDTMQTHIVEFGELLFGERLPWITKEIWLNQLAPGGHQNVHSHANSFISGVVYLTEAHASCRTVFYRNMGGRDFAFTNEHRDVKLGAYNAPRWAVPNQMPGDAVLFPSYLLHEVPRNQGSERMTLAFNAVPQRLKSWDYVLQFS